MSTLHEEFTFSPGSIEFRDAVQALLSKKLKALAMERARSNRREEVTLDDFKQSLPDAIREILQEINQTPVTF